jgi:hypothetical protein
MGTSNSLAWTSVILSLIVATIAILLGLHLCWERHARNGELPAADRKHFLLQDLRRGFGIALMAFLAIGVYVGSRLPTFVVEPRNPGVRGTVESAAGAIVQAALETHPNRRFLAVWMGVFASVVLLLGLALIDWLSTRRYAQRLRREMHRERLEILRETMQHSKSAEDGLANGRSIESL